MNKIENINKLDKIMIEHKHNPQWIQIRGFYNRVRWKGGQSFGDFLDTTNSLRKSLEKQGHTLTPECVIELMKLYNKETEAEE